MLVSILLLITGFVILIKGADFLVDGAVAVAAKLRVSPLMIGLTIVAFGTSAPELVVNIIAAFNYPGAGIGFGNIVGSNIANIGLIIGASALVFPVLVKPSVITREIPFMFFSAVIFLILVSDQIFGTGTENALTLFDGLILLFFFIFFIYYLTADILRQRKTELTDQFVEEYDHQKAQMSFFKAWAALILGLVAVIGGGKLVVDAAAVIARGIGVSEVMIGLTVIAIGTSLPELTTSLVAAFKKSADVAVGNVVGSNVFNTFLILGVNATISPVPVRSEWFVDLGMMLLLSLLLFSVGFSGKIRQYEGGYLLFIYISYIIFTIIRG